VVAVFPPEVGSVRGTQELRPQIFPVMVLPLTISLRRDPSPPPKARRDSLSINRNRGPF